MPQLEILAFGDQFSLVFLCLVVVFYRIIVIHFFAYLKTIVFNKFTDGLESDQCL